MFVSRLMQIVAAASSGIAILALSLLPVEHLHRSHDGPTVIHRHFVEEAADAHHESSHETGEAAHAVFHHDDQTDARPLTPAFVAKQQYFVLAPLFVAVLLLPASEPQIVTWIDVDDVPLAHGPPIRLNSLRGPPA